MAERNVVKQALKDEIRGSVECPYILYRRLRRNVGERVPVELVTELLNELIREGVLRVQPDKTDRYFVIASVI